MNEGTFEGLGGLKIFWRSWGPAGTPRGVMALVHGFNSHSGSYEWAAEQFAADGLAVYALDLRGRGRSEGERFYVESFSEYVDDVARLVDRAKSENPGLPVYLLGHSAGGVVSCGYAAEYQDRINGLICESFAFDVGVPNVAGLLLKGLAHLAPHLHTFTLKNEIFSRDPAVVEKMNSDPLIKDESQPAETSTQMLQASALLDTQFPNFKLPLLIIHGTADKATKPAGSQHFFDTAGSADKTLKLYEGHYHDLLNDIGKEEVMADILSWINARLPAGEAAAGSSPA